MADPRLFAGPVAAEQLAATSTLRALLDSVPGADVPYSESHNNPHLVSSPVGLLEMATIDPLIREEHGLTALVGALVRVVADQQRQIEELKQEPATPKGKAGR
jgi:hypothetical protein